MRETRTAGGHLIGLGIAFEVIQEVKGTGAIVALLSP